MLEPLDSLVEVERFLRRKLQSLSRANNLTISEWQLLKRIVGGENTQSVLSSNTSLDVSTLSRQLARLTAKNFLKKKRFRQLIPKPVRRLVIQSAKQVNVLLNR